MIPVSTWVIVLLWAVIVMVFLHKLRATSSLDSTTLRILAAVVLIEAGRELLEHLYLGAMADGDPARSGLPPLARLVNILAAGVILLILVWWRPPRADSSAATGLKMKGRYRDVIASIDGIVWEADPASLQITLINDAVERILGYPVDRWINEPTFWRDHLHPADLAPVTEALLALRPDERIRELTYRVIAASGNAVWLQSTIGLGRDKDGTARLHGLSIDITARKRYELRVAEDERFIKTIADNLPALVTYWRRDLTCAFANRSVYDWFGHDRTEVIGTDMRAHLGDDLFAQDYPHIAKVLQGEPQLFPRTLVKADGTRIETVAQFVPDLVGTEVRGFFALVSDITSIKAKETQLALLEKSIARLNDIVMITEANTADTERARIVYVNDAFKRHTGYNPAEVIGQSPRFLIGPKTIEEEVTRIRAALAQTAPVHAELIIHRKDGTDFLVEIDITPLGDADGNVTHMVSILRDITDRQRQEQEKLEAIRRQSESEAFADLVLQSVDAAITVCDRDGRMLRVNRMAEIISGYSEEEFKDPTAFARIIPADEWEAVARILTSRDPKTFPVTHVNHWVSRTGERRLLRWSNVALTDDRGDLSLMISIGFDITDLRQHERALIAAKNQAEMANRAKSSFLATMSHELRTPLNAIIGFSDIMAQQSFGPIHNPKYAEYVNDICNSGKQLLSIINDILDLSRVEAGKQDIKIETLALADAWTPIASGLIAAARRKNIALIAPERPSELKLLADRRAVMQILTNLISNSVKFTPAGGEIQLMGRRAEGGDEVVLTVRDTGRGIPPERLKDVMRPFVQIANSYNRDEGGVGLGLAICSGLAASMQGRIEIESELGIGTTVFVYLPAVMA